MKSHTKKVAITGSIGSGKSTFCKILLEKGYTVINADQLSKKLLISNEEIINKIIRIFGNESFVDNEINKKYIADKVFSAPVNVQKMNSIVHPVVISEIKRIFNEKENEKIIFVEAALIYEADMEGIFDYVVLISADENIRKERKIKNSNMTVNEFEKRDINQIPDSEKRKRADFVFENNSTFKDLKNKAELLIILLTNGTT